jgi:hypothetical protein
MFSDGSWHILSCSDLVFSIVFVGLMAFEAADCGSRVKSI